MPVKNNSRVYEKYRLCPGPLGEEFVQIWGDDPKVFKQKALLVLHQAIQLLKRYHAKDLAEAFSVMGAMAAPGSSSLNPAEPEQQLELPDLTAEDLSSFDLF
jgi:hypothetical protein